MICFGIAVSMFSADTDVILILFQSDNISGQGIIHPKFGRFAMTSASYRSIRIKLAEFSKLLYLLKIFDGVFFSEAEFYTEFWMR